MELLNEAKGTILKLLVVFFVLVYLALTGIHMANRLPIHRALWGVKIDARVAFNCPTNTRGIWEVINRDQEADSTLGSGGRTGKYYTEDCG